MKGFVLKEGTKLPHTERGKERLPEVKGGTGLDAGNHIPDIPQGRILVSGVLLILVFIEEIPQGDSAEPHADGKDIFLVI